MSEEGEIEEIEDYIIQQEIPQKNILFPPRKSEKASAFIQSITSIIAKTRQVLKCPICHKRLFKPYVLPCSHRFCLRCWQNNQTTFKIICPKCKKTTNRNYAVADKTLPIILKLFQDMLDIKQRVGISLEKEKMKRIGQRAVYDRQVKKRFKYNQATLIEVQEQKQRQIQAKSQIKIYSRRMNINKFYQSQLSKGQFEIIMDIVEGKSKESLNQAQSIASTDHKNQNSSRKKTSHSKKQPSSPRDRNSQILKNQNSKKIQFINISSEEIALSETKSVDQQKTFTQSRATQGKEIKDNTLKLRVPIGRVSRQREILSRSLPSKSQYASQNLTTVLSRSFNEHRQRSTKKFDYLKLRLHNYPGDYITPKLSFNQILCPKDKQIDFIRNLLAFEIGCNNQQLFLFQNIQGVMRPIPKTNKVTRLFDKSQQNKHKHRGDWRAVLNKISENIPLDHQAISGMRLQGTIYFKVVMKTE